jgi:hypothetical protein
MAHTYFGSDGLILTSITKENFDSGLSRVDCIYKCRTTKADALEQTLVAGLRVPDRQDYLIRENAKRKDETDGFTTFTLSGFYATLVTSPNTVTPIPSVLGAQRSNLALYTITQTSVTPYVKTYNLDILADTITQKFTLQPTDSITKLNIPSQMLSAKIQRISDASGNPYTISELETILSAGWSYYEPSASTTYSYRSNYIDGTLKASLVGDVVIVNINRSNFGSYDEVTITWGLDFGPITLQVSYTESGRSVS